MRAMHRVFIVGLSLAFVVSGCGSSGGGSSSGTAVGESTADGPTTAGDNTSGETTEGETSTGDPGTGESTGDTSTGEPSGEGSTGDTDPEQGSYNPNPTCLQVDRVDTSKVVPPAGLQVTFRVLDCDGNPVKPLDENDTVSVINDESGQDFTESSEGGSASGYNELKNTQLFSVIALDLSNSVVNTEGAQEDVLDAAQFFVDSMLSDSGGLFEHQIAIMAFGSSSQTTVEIDFTSDQEALTEVLNALREDEGRGTTNLYGAYMQAINLVRAKGDSDAVVERFAVTLTDGTHEAGDTENLRAQALALKAETAETVRTFSVGVEGDYDACKLEELAGSGCREGDECDPDEFPPMSCYQYLSASSTGELEDIFDAIAQRALGIARSNYVMGVCTPVELGSPSMTIQVTIGDATGEASASYATSALTGALNQCDAQAIADGPLICENGICEVDAEVEPEVEPGSGDSGFCELYAQTCDGIWTCGPDEDEDCALLDCAAWWAAAAPGTDADTAGATQGCYSYHLSVATSDEQAAEIHCPHAKGEVICVDD